MAQFARPDNDDVVTGLWDDEEASGANFWNGIDETSFDDSDWVQSPNNPDDSELYTYGLSSVIDPEVSTGHVVHFRVGKHNDGGRSVSAVIRLRNNTGGVVASWSKTNAQLDTITIYNEILTEAEADSLVAADYAGGWQVEHDPVTAGGGAGRRYRITWAQIEVPNAPAGDITDHAFKYRSGWW